MEEKKKLVAVAGLRKAEPTTLQVLTQDVLRTPLVRIEPSTLADLLALSELGADQLPGSLVKELDAFRDQMFRELSDLPDGPPLAAYLSTLTVVSPEQFPACFREAVRALAPERKDEDAVEALEGFLERVDGTEPETISLPKQAEAGSPGSAPVEVLKTKEKPKKTGSKRGSRAKVDERRGVWIADDAIDRLKQYHNGLKEAILVAGCAHRAPWDDVTPKEIMSVLRRLKREGRLRYSAGRWYIQK